MILLKVMLDQGLVKEEKIPRPSLTIYKTILILSLKLFSHTMVGGQEKEKWMKGRENTWGPPSGSPV